MTVTDKVTAHDTDADLARLLDKGYEIRFTKITPSYSMGDIDGYLVNLTGPLGSHSRGMGETPGEALRAVWPLNDEDQADEDDPGDEDDEDEPFCTECGGRIGIFYGHGDGWHHYRGDGTAASPVELYDAGHAPAVGWRPAGMR